MSTKNIHVLKTRPPESVGDRAAAVLGHIVAAHTKLERLQALRREMKAEFQLCQGERDAALRELERVKEQLSASESMLNESEEVVIAQKELIDELRGERELPDEPATPVTDHHPGLIASAVARHEQNLAALGKSDFVEAAVDDNVTLLSRALDGLTRLVGHRKS